MDRQPDSTMRRKSVVDQVLVKIKELVGWRLVDRSVHLETRLAHVEETAGRAERDGRDGHDDNLVGRDTSGGGDGSNVLGLDVRGEICWGDLQGDLRVDDRGNDAAVARLASALAEVP